MRIRFGTPRFAVAVLTALAAAATAVQAEDVLVMPFRCAVVDGRPVLTPSDETGHRVLGRLDQQKVKTCSTVDPKRCRQWATFKFDMDCGGSRVSWMQVFANASEHTRRRVWERDGRLRVQDTKRRSKRIDDMCARRLSANMEWASVNEICDEVSTLNVPTATDMPAGFAPMVGLDAVFLPEDAIRMPPSRVAKAMPAVPARGETASIAVPAAQPKQAPAASTHAARQPAVATSSQREVTPGRTAAVRETTPVGAPVTPVSPQVGEVSAREPVATVAAVAATPTESGSQVATPMAVAPAAEEAVATVSDEATSIDRPRTEELPGVELPQSKAPAPETVITAGEQDADNGGSMLAYIITVLASGLLVATLLIVKWLGRANTSEDVGGANIEPVLGMPAARSEAAAAAGVGSVASGMALAVVTHHHVSGQRLATQASRRGTRAMNFGDRMPSSQGEALELLGMGVASDSNLTSLKKIIDGLRMNWHPDHAQDDADRRIRELRLKQINAAWEILGGKATGLGGKTAGV